MDRLKKWLCLVGIHQYGAWSHVDLDLIPMGDVGTDWALLDCGVDINNLHLDTTHRECSRCGHTQVRQSVKW